MTAANVVAALCITGPFWALTFGAVVAEFLEGRRSK